MMQLSISREDLLKPLSQVAGVVEKRQTLPILSNILVKAEGNRLTMIGTDLEVEVINEIGVQKLEPGTTTIPARKLLDICRALPADASISIKKDGDRIIVKAGKSRFSLISMAADDFPSIETQDWLLSLKAPQKKLKGLFDKTQFCMAQQDVRYYLNGLLLEFQGKKLRAVGTDGHRMAVSEIDMAQDVGEIRQVILPRKGVIELGRFLEESDSEVELMISPNHLRAKMGGMVFTSKLIDGRFPDYHKVIPSSQTKHIKIGRDTFKEAVQRTSILSNEKYRGLRFNISPDNLTITAHNPEQEEAQEELVIDYKGEEMEIGFNSNYIIEAVSALSSKEVEFGLNDSNSSGTLRDPNDTTTQYIVMPMRL